MNPSSPSSTLNPANPASPLSPLNPINPNNIYNESDGGGYVDPTAVLIIMIIFVAILITGLIIICKDN